MIFLKTTDFGIQKLDGWMKVLDVFTSHAYTNMSISIPHIFEERLKI